MKKRTALKQMVTIPMLLAALILLLTGTNRAQTQELVDKNSADNESNAQSSGGAGKSTGLISLLPGQALRVAAVNVGNKAIPLQLYVIPVSDQGKAQVAIQCNAIVSPGDAAFDAYLHPGGVNRVLLYVQVRVRQNPNDIKDLVPSVEVFDMQTGRTDYALSGADFASFRPIFNPPLAPEK